MVWLLLGGVVVAGLAVCGWIRDAQRRREGLECDIRNQRIEIDNLKRRVDDLEFTASISESVHDQTMLELQESQLRQHQDQFADR